METRCPYCESSVQVETGSTLDEIKCSVCGDSFNILEQPTLQYEGDSTRRVGHFELVSQIGSGAYGAVWKARDLELDRTVALKIPRRGVVDSGGPDAFLREAQAAAQLQHPNIVSVHEIGRDEDSLFIVSDFIDGLTLADWLSDGRTAAPREAAAWIIKLAQALQHAHEAGIVHRDIKPSNIMLDRNNEPYVMDFGLAKREAVDLTVTVEGMVLGTPAYMSPEQARGEGNQADHRSDIYSLGVILFQLLTGERPFRGSARMIMHQVIHDDPPHPKKLSANVPADLDTICLKCMEKVPSQRFESAAELVDELERFLRGEPIHSRPLSAATRGWRWCRRNPVIAMLASLLIIALSVGVSGIILQSVRANMNAARANFEAGRALASAESERGAHRKTSRYLYVANMNMVQQAFEMSDPARAVAILNRQLGNEHRGFEWFYWWRQCHRWRSHYLGHDRAVYAAAFSADGRYLASAGLDGRVILWDAGSGDKIHEWEHPDRVFTVAFSPDSKMVASGCFDTKVRLWDVASGEPVRTLEGHKNSVFSLLFSANGETIITGSGDHTVGVWNVASGKRLATLGGDEQGHIDFVYAVALDHAGKRIASAGLDRTVKIWDLDSGKVLHTLSGHELEVWCVDFSKDDAFVASGSGDGTIRVWNVETGELSTLMRGHSDRVRSLRFLPRGKLLVSGGQDRRVVLWDVEDLKPEEPEEIRRQPNRRGNYFFERQDFPERKRMLATLQGHGGSVNGVAVSADGGWLATASEDRTLKRWDIAECLEPSVLRGHNSSVNVVAIDKEGKLLLTGSNDKTARLWDLSTGRPIGEPLPHEHWVLAAAFSSDGQMFATGSYDGRISVYRRQSTEPIRVLTKHTGPVSCLAFSDEGTLYSGSHDRTIKAWNADTGQLLQTLEGHERSVTAVRVSPDGRQLASSSLDGTARIWDLADLQAKPKEIAHPTSVYALAFSPNGEKLATSGERSLRFWDLKSGELERTVRAHANRINSLAYSPDGRTIASGGGDKVIKIWDVETGEPKTTLRGHGHRVWSLVFTPDGRMLASSSYKLRLWRGALHRVVDGRIDTFDQEKKGGLENSVAP